MGGEVGGRDGIRRNHHGKVKGFISFGSHLGSQSPFIPALTCVPTVRLEVIAGHIRASERAGPFTRSVPSTTGTSKSGRQWYGSVV